MNHALLGFIVGGEVLWWMNLLIFVGVYLLLAVSLNLINGFAGMFHLGQHGFWALGAYGAAWLTIRLHAAGYPGWEIFVLSALLAMAVAAVGGLVIGLPCLRLRGDYLAIATLGFGEIVRIALQNSDPHTLGGSRGLRIPRVLMHVNRETQANFRLLILGILVLCSVLTIWGIRNFIRSGPGRRMLAVAQDETAAGLLGINPVRSKLLAFVVGAAIAGLAGAIFAHYEGYITPKNFDFMKMVMMFLIIVLGGMGSLSGTIVASFLVIATERFLSRTPEAIYNWWQVLFPFILACLIIFRPQGIFGTRELSDVVRDWIRRRRKPA